MGRSEYNSRHMLPADEIATFCSQISLVLQAGIPLYDGMETLVESCKDKKAKAAMKKIAEDEKIKYQNEVLPFGGTDAGSMQTARGGCMAGGISIPTAYIHSVNEMIDISDVKEAIKLTKVIAERM